MYTKMGDIVKVHYIGRLRDGSVFDSTKDRDPVEFTVGAGHLITGFEQAVIGMIPGRSKTKVVPARLAYGPRIEALVQEINRTDLPKDLELKVGQRLHLHLPGDGSLAVTVVDIGHESVVLDANHPLAGEDLEFTIELLEIVN